MRKNSNLKVIKNILKFFKNIFTFTYSENVVIQKNIRSNGMIVGGDLICINGKRYTGKNIKIRNGVVSINGKEVDRLEDTSININNY